MDSIDLDLVWRTEIPKIIYKVKWNIGNARKIPESIISPKFSFSPRFDKDWYLTIQYSEDDSICVLLSRVSKDEQTIRVECTTCVKDGTGERFAVTVGNIYHAKETHIICNHLCTFSDSLVECTLNLEFNFIVYGFKVETEVSYCDDEGVDDADEDGNKFADMINNEKLADVQIHVGKEVFNAHKYILRQRASKFVDKHLRFVNKTTLYKMNAETFKCLLSYIYKKELSAIELSQCPKELYEVAGTYDLKRLQKICTQELKKELKFENVVEYLKMAEKHKEESLKIAASSFIKKNLDAMYRRTDWTALIASRPSLESEVLHTDSD